MNEMFQVTKIVLSLEQCAFIVKWYDETHFFKCVRKFPNSVTPFNHAILLLKKIRKQTYARMIYRTWDDHLL